MSNACRTKSLKFSRNFKCDLQVSGQVFHILMSSNNWCMEFTVWLLQSCFLLQTCASRLSNEFAQNVKVDHFLLTRFGSVVQGMTIQREILTWKSCLLRSNLVQKLRSGHLGSKNILLHRNEHIALFYASQLRCFPIDQSLVSCFSIGSVFSLTLPSAWLPVRGPRNYPLSWLCQKRLVSKGFTEMIFVTLNTIILAKTYRAAGRRNKVQKSKILGDF